MKGREDVSETGRCLYRGNGRYQCNVKVSAEESVSKFGRFLYGGQGRCQCNVMASSWSEKEGASVTGMYMYERKGMNPFDGKASV